MQKGNKPPDRLPKLIEAHREQLRAAKKRFRKRTRVILAGKSMGSRVGCHLSLEEDVAGVVCLGYPLQGISKTAALRDEVLRAMHTPLLFVQGTRDRLCPLDLLKEVRDELTNTTQLHVVTEGDHSLVITKRHTKATGRTQDDEDATALAVIAEFVGALPN